jgi:hypothetical protein
MDGQQHHREPYKDKAGVLSVAERPEWNRIPKYRTRSDMISQRRAARHPDLSFDIDGDGIVSSTDYFIAKQFSQENDHRLNTAERAQAVESLESGFLDQYSFGHDQCGIGRLHTFRHVQGKVITDDNIEDLGEIHPPHWNASKEPKHRGRSELEFRRKASRRNGNIALAQAWEAKHPQYVLEPRVQQEQMDPEPEFASTTQRRAAMRSSAREDAGLDSVNSSVNPAKEDAEIGLAFSPQPEIATRSQLQEARRAQKQRDLLEARCRGEKDYVPKGSRLTMKAVEVFDQLRAAAQEGAMTLTKLKQQRRAQGIEHNMSNFALGVEPSGGHADGGSLGGFSGQGKPWWTLREDYQMAPPICLLKELQSPPARAEPSKKVTEVAPPAPPLASHVLPPASSTPPQLDSKSTALFQRPEISDQSLKQMTKEFALPKMRPEPQLFEGVKQASTVSMDSVLLNNFSSFNTIRDNSMRQEEGKQQRNAREDQQRAEAWQRFLQEGPAAMPAVTGPMELVEPVRESSAALAANLQREASSSAAVGPHVTQREASSVGKSQQSHRHEAMPPASVMVDPSGEDLPMTQRLERLANEKPETPARGTAASSSLPARPVSEKSSIRGSARCGAAAQGDRSRESMVVRSSGFQWLQQRAAHLQHDAEVASTIGAFSSPLTSRMLSSLVQVPKGPGSHGSGSGH